MPRIPFKVGSGDQKDFGIRLTDLYPGRSIERADEIGLVDAHKKIDFGSRKKILHRLQVGIPDGNAHRAR